MIRTTLFVLHIFLSTLIGYGQDSEKVETTVFYFIRHAEKDISNPDNKNPNLTDKGKIRAEDWAKILVDTKIDFVFSTDYLRTQQTAKPIAEKNKLNVQLYDPRNLYNPDFQAKTKGKTSVIVGHSNSTPSFVNKILKQQKYNSIDEKDYGKLFIVTIKENIVTDHVLNFN